MVRLPRSRSRNRIVAVVSAVALVTPVLAGCAPSGTATSNSGAPQQQGQPNYGVVPAPPQARQNQGLSTKQKVAILAGTAALMYLYDRHKNAQGTGPNGQYYQSKNGRIYYRDEKGNAVWVTPPAGGIQVPADVAQRYSQYSNSYSGGGAMPPGPGGL